MNETMEMSKIGGIFLLIFIIIVGIVGTIGWILSIIGLVYGIRLNDTRKIIWGIVGLFIPLCGFYAYYMHKELQDKYRDKEKEIINKKIDDLK